jgi:hypothetical protein
MSTAVSSSAAELHQQIMDIVTEVETTCAMPVERPGKRKHSEVDVADPDLSVDHVVPSAAKRAHACSGSTTTTSNGANGIAIVCTDNTCVTHANTAGSSTNNHNGNGTSSSNSNTTSHTTDTNTLVAMDTASLSSRVSSDAHHLPLSLANQDSAEHTCESTLRMRPIQQGIRRQRRPSSLRSRDGIGALMPAPAGGPLTPLTLYPSTTVTEAVTERESTTGTSAASLESEEAPWLDVDRNVRKMDETFDASFHAWLRNEANVWVSAGYLQRLAIEYPAERTARALAWLAEGWSVRSAAVLARVVTLRWCLAAGVIDQSTIGAHSGTGTSMLDKLIKPPASSSLYLSGVAASNTTTTTTATATASSSTVQRCCHLCCATTSLTYPSTPISTTSNLTTATCTTPVPASNIMPSSSSPATLSNSNHSNAAIVSDLTRSHQLRGVAKVVCAITRSYAPRDVGRLLTAAYGDLDVPRLQALVELVGVGWPANDFAVLVSSLGDPVPANVRLALLDRVRHTLSIERISSYTGCGNLTTANVMNPMTQSVLHRSLANAMATNNGARIATTAAAAATSNTLRHPVPLHIRTGITLYANPSIPPAPRSAPLFGRMDISTTATGSSNTTGTTTFI